jgi:hypothetical protein
MQRNWHVPDARAAAAAAACAPLSCRAIVSSLSTDWSIRVRRAERSPPAVRARAALTDWVHTTESTRMTERVGKEGTQRSACNHQGEGARAHVASTKDMWASAADP